MARCTGIKRDLRLTTTETYANYYFINFRSYIGSHGDCYDRFLIRMNEMAEATSIINQTVNKIGCNTGTHVELNTHKILNTISLPTKHKSHNIKFQNTMETLIDHYKY